MKRKLILLSVAIFMVLGLGVNNVTEANPPQGQNITLLDLLGWLANARYQNYLFALEKYNQEVNYIDSFLQQGGGLISLYKVNLAKDEAERKLKAYEKTLQVYNWVSNWLDRTKPNFAEQERKNDSGSWRDGNAQGNMTFVPHMGGRKESGIIEWK